MSLYNEKSTDINELVEGIPYRKSSNEEGKQEIYTKLSLFDSVIYWATLLFVLVMPFLFSRLTTENFLTPKEFFTRGFIGLIGGLLCFHLFYKAKVTLVKTKLDFPLFAFFGFCALSVLWNYNSLSAIRDLRCVFLVMLLFPIIVNVFKNRWQVELLLWVMVFTGLATATIGFLETYNLYFCFHPVNGIYLAKDEILINKVIHPNAFYIPLFPQLASPDYAMGSVVSTFGNRNYLGTFVMFVAFIPLAFYFYYKNKYMKILSIGIFSWLLYGLYMTRCRASLIGLAVGIIFMIIALLLNDKGFRLVKKNSIFFGVVVVLFVIGLVVSALTIKSESMWDKIKLTFTLDRLVSNTYERMWVWYGNNKTFTNNLRTLAIGEGFGSFKHIFPLKEGDVYSEKNKESFTAVTFRQAHNDWLQIFSELGIIGMVLFLFIVKRFYGSIQEALRKDIFINESDEMNGDHILVIAIGAAVLAQLFAGLPDFPFHRIETAVFAVIFLALVPVLTETNFFKKPIEQVSLEIGFKYNFKISFILIAFVVLASLMNLIYEHHCWAADTKVREAEMMMSYQSNNPGAMAKAKDLLLNAIRLDPLPGDPYSKLSAWYEQVDKDPRVALKYADMAWKNINFNARSTYHSVLFRKMHIYYHLMNNLPMAYNQALKALQITAGEARSIYYLYAGKIAADMLRLKGLVHESEEESVKINAEKYLKKAMEYPQFKLQSQASLAIFLATYQRWQEAFDAANEVCIACNNADPTMLSIVGIAGRNIGKYEIALRAMENALKYYPNNPVYHRDLGMLYKQLNKIPEARKHLEICIASKDCPEEIRVIALKELDSLKQSN